MNIFRHIQVGKQLSKDFLWPFWKAALTVIGLGLVFNLLFLVAGLHGHWVAAIRMLLISIPLAIGAERIWLNRVDGEAYKLTQVFFVYKQPLQYIGGVFGIVVIALFGALFLQLLPYFVLRLLNLSPNVALWSSRVFYWGIFVIPYLVLVWYCMADDNDAMESLKKPFTLSFRKWLSFAAGYYICVILGVLSGLLLLIPLFWTAPILKLSVANFYRELFPLITTEAE